MQELEITWPRVLSVWWLVAWRTWLGALILGIVVGGGLGALAAMVVGLVGSPGAAPGELEATAAYVGDTVGAVSATLAGLVWGLCVVRMALRKRYRDFRLALVPEPRGGA